MSVFQVGDRVKLVDTDGPYEIPNGSLGTVTEVGDRYDRGLIGVRFDGGFDTLGGRMFDYRFEKVAAPKFKVGDRVTAGDYPFDNPGSVGAVTKVGGHILYGGNGVTEYAVKFENDVDGFYGDGEYALDETDLTAAPADPKIKVGDRVRTTKYWYGTGTVTEAYSGSFDGYYEVTMDESQGPYGHSVGAFEAKNLEKLPDIGIVTTLTVGDVLHSEALFDRIEDGTVVRDRVDFFGYVWGGMVQGFGTNDEFELIALMTPVTIVAVDV